MVQTAGKKDSTRKNLKIDAELHRRIDMASAKFDVAIYNLVDRAWNLYESKELKVDNAHTIDVERLVSKIRRKFADEQEPTIRNLLAAIENLVDAWEPKKSKRIE